MRVTIVGSGDAFGSGGRLQTCFHVAAAGRQFLIDCGVTTLTGLNALGCDPNEIDTILISHLHGDHFGGLVWFMLHAAHVAKRTGPLTIAGPPGLHERYVAAAEALFPGMTQRAPRFEVVWQVLEAGTRDQVAGIEVTPFTVSHPSGAPAYALRIGFAGRTVAFSGDTEWVDALVDVAAGADLFITECYGFEQPARFHMHWRLIEEKLPLITARKIVLTHMSEVMLSAAHNAEQAGVLLGEDGLVIEL